MARVCKLVELDGTKTVVRTLVTTSVGQVPVDPLNPRGQEYVTITLPQYETGSAIGQYDDIYLGRHIQVFEATTLLFEGVPMKRRKGKGSIQVDVHDQGWYFAKTNLDAPVRNLLVNGNFEAGTTGWTAVGCTMTPVSSPVRRGSTAMKLVGTTTFGEQYIYQQVVVTGTAVGTALTAAAHFNIDSWTGPAIYNRGLFLQSVDSGTVETFNDEEGVIDDDTALGLDEWQRDEATEWVPPNATRTIEVRLYCPNGTIYWDEVELVEPTSLAIAPGAGEDIATTFNRIVQFAQDSTKGKSDKQIGTDTPPTTGTKFYFPKSWQYADHTAVDTAMQEIVSLGVDYAFEHTTTATRVLLYAPQKGDDLTGSITLQLTVPPDPDDNLASYDYEEDHDAVETSVTILGEGDGPDREEGYAVDAIDANGLVLQGLESVPTGTTIDKLDDLAAARLALKKAPVRTLKVRTKGTVAVTTGDTVTVAVTDGVIGLSGGWRIVAGWHVPKSNGCLDLELVPTATALSIDGGASGTVSAVVYDAGSSDSTYSYIDGGRAA